MFRLYAYIGCKLAAEFPDHSHEYSEWIKTYSGTAALEQASKIEDLLILLAPGEDLGGNLFTWTPSSLSPQSH
jgi:thiaminase